MFVQHMYNFFSFYFFFNSFRLFGKMKRWVKFSTGIRKLIARLTNWVWGPAGSVDVQLQLPWLGRAALSR